LEITASLYFCLSASKAATVSGNGCQILTESTKQFISVPDAVCVGIKLNYLPRLFTLFAKYPDILYKNYSGFLVRIQILQKSLKFRHR
jgi:hypothetical protein